VSRVLEDGRFDRITELLKALTEHSKHGEELRAELFAEIARARRRDPDDAAAALDRRAALNRRARRRRRSD
jgi:hypothetical protein